MSLKYEAKWFYINMKSTRQQELPCNYIVICLYKKGRNIVRDLKLSAVK